MTQSIPMVTKILGDDLHEFGPTSVSGAGDVNKDGVADLVIGFGAASPWGGGDLAGMVFTIYGSNTSYITDVNLLYMNWSQGFRIIGANTYDMNGGSVSKAGDVNNDNIDDIIIGTDSSTGGPRPAEYGKTAYVIYGKQGGRANIYLSSLTPEQGFRIIGTDNNSYFTVSAAGDVNHDNVDDIIIGSYSESPSGKKAAGISYVIYGKPGGLADLNLSSLTSAQGFRILGANSNDASGRSVSKAGDMNADQVDDIIIGAPNASPGSPIRYNAGISYVIYGKPGGSSDIDLGSNFSLVQGFRILGANAGISTGDHTGISVSGTGVISGFLNAVIIGAPDAAPNGKNQAGISYVIYFTAGSRSSDIDLSDNFVRNQGFSVLGITGNSAVQIGDSAGTSVSGAGDFDGDGFDDIIIGAPYASTGVIRSAGASYVIYGSASVLSNIDLASGLAPAQGFSIFGPSVDASVGTSVSGAGDMNGDGLADIVIKSTTNNIYIVYGQKGKLLTTVDLSKYSGVNIIGTNNADTLTGNNIWGLDGDDVLTVMTTGSGVLDGGTGINTVCYINFSPTNAALVINMGSGDSLGNTFVNSPSLTIQNLIGSNNNDTIIGNPSYANTIEGRGGGDTITGTSGISYIVTYANSPAAVSINLVTNINTGGDAEGDKLYSIQNIIGSAHNDNITGNTQDNNIQGGDGNDILDGGGGIIDTLTGDNGIDTFVVKNTPGNVIINDFNVNNEKIDLRSFTNIYNIESLNIPSSQGGNTEILLSTGKITLIGATELSNNNFLFYPEPPEPDGPGWWTPSRIGIVSGVSGGVLAFSLLSFIIWKLKHTENRVIDVHDVTVASSRFLLDKISEEDYSGFNAAADGSEIVVIGDN